MKKKVYISGAIAHYDLDERKAAFNHAARYLSIKGYEPVNPFENGISQDARRMKLIGEPRCGPTLACCWLVTISTC